MHFFISTKGHYDFIDITLKVREIVASSEKKEGAVLVFARGSTVALTLIENESGIFEDLKSVLEKLIPEHFDYNHNKNSGDKNGAAHIKSAIFQPEVIIPFANNELLLGPWQQIVLIDFDERPRDREIIVKII